MKRLAGTAVSHYFFAMSSRIAWHSLRWLLLTLAGGLLYDGLKSSVVASGFERLLPDLVFLIKPVMVVVGITLGGTFLSISSVDLRRAWRKRTDDKKEAIRKADALKLKREKESLLAAEQKKQDKRKRKKQFILKRLDFLVDWHDGHKYVSQRSHARKANDQVMAIEYTHDLVRCKLVHPARYKEITTWGSHYGLNYLAIVRGKLKIRGLEATQEWAAKFQPPNKRASNIDTGVD